MKFAYGAPVLSAPIADAFQSGEAIAGLGSAAEKAGFGAFSFSEHPAPPEKWRVNGHDAFDPFIALSFVAAATSTLRIMSNAAILPYHNPFLLAKTVSTLDLLSGGRLILGVGTGYLKAEMSALGCPPELRNERFDEALAVMKKIWSGEVVSHDGSTFSAREVRALPVPPQRPHPPIWFGGNSRLSRLRAVNEGQGWMPFPNPRQYAHMARTAALESLEDLEGMLTFMRAKAAEVGRAEPIDVMCVLPPTDNPDENAELIERYQALGVTWCHVNGNGKTLSEATDFIAGYGDRIIARA